MAKGESLPILKLIATVSNEELRERLDSAWQNVGVLSAFVAAVAVSFLFVNLPIIDEFDPEYDLKQRVQTSFYTMAAVASILLILTVSLLLTNMTSLLVIPVEYIGAYLHKIGPFEGVPSILMVISIVTLVALIPMFIYLNFGSGVEFKVTAAVAIVATLFGLGWQFVMMKLQNTLLDKWMAERAQHGALQTRLAEQQKGSEENPISEVHNRF